MTTVSTASSVPPRHRQKWALITGVSPGGIGEAMAQAFLARGVNVIATNPELPSDSKTPTLDFSWPEAGSSAGHQVTFKLDVTDPHSIALAVMRVEALTDGRLDFLLNNAGYGYMMPILDLDLDRARQQFEVNFFSVVALTQAFFPMLRATEGTIVNQGSIGGLAGCYQPFIGCYTASKAALMHLSNTMRAELSPFGIQVVTLVTGDVKTEFWRNADGAMGGLPITSTYMPMRQKAEAMMRGETNPGKSADRKEVAEKTVDELLSGCPGAFIRRGYLATIMWIISATFPTVLLDILYWQAAEFGRFRAMLSKSPSPPPPPVDKKSM
ncbi:NAD(P)-binding protein [Polychaeton citri CBS 116435]|uniref:NAD(P)-binding protein n=1 Tax=Polychaeton citri CBS 116435 TaxID=1314669 RepID=A0A9P4Q2Z8_9PEZI|nr:NAD(P)-binding protein [Polychaeton citri CBS 116435]